jgi:hypothetical protein
MVFMLPIIVSNHLITNNINYFSVDRYAFKGDNTIVRFI